MRGCRAGFRNVFIAHRPRRVRGLGRGVDWVRWVRAGHRHSRRGQRARQRGIGDGVGGRSQGTASKPVQRARTGGTTRKSRRRGLGHEGP